MEERERNVAPLDLPLVGLGLEYYHLFLLGKYYDNLDPQTSAETEKSPIAADRVFSELLGMHYWRQHLVTARVYEVRTHHKRHFGKSEEFAATLGRRTNELNKGQRNSLTSLVVSEAVAFAFQFSSQLGVLEQSTGGFPEVVRCIQFAIKAEGFWDEREDVFSSPDHVWSLVQELTPLMEKVGGLKMIQTAWQTVFRESQLSDGELVKPGWKIRVAK